MGTVAAVAGTWGESAQRQGTSKGPALQAGWFQKGGLKEK